MSSLCSQAARACVMDTTLGEKITVFSMFAEQQGPLRCLRVEVPGGTMPSPCLNEIGQESPPRRCVHTLPCFSKGRADTDTGPSSGFSPAAAEGLFQRRELRREQASLAWVEMPFSARLYLSVAPAPSPDEIRKVGQWRAKEGCSTGTLEAGRAADEVVVERWEDGCVRKIPACALNPAPGTYHLAPPLLGGAVATAVSVWSNSASFRLARLAGGS
ncbi:unnamed protein product [Pleuronectes platessa]|uniref:Uncharacterized protein n=1 Tax=Pleuronectes platessa TaxID=8262 RepID=A0A9N7TZ45_PLEPL|nr:unnamed protein product [Pleuronectes platessa]